MQTDGEKSIFAKRCDGIGDDGEAFRIDFFRKALGSRGEDEVIRPSSLMSDFSLHFPHH